MYILEQSGELTTIKEITPDIEAGVKDGMMSVIKEAYLKLDVDAKTWVALEPRETI